MAMEKQYMIRDAHTRSVTAISYHPARRELFIGFEDGHIKTFEAETGKPVNHLNEHTGWVTDLLYWSDAKLMLSCSNDGDIIAWGAGGGVADRIVFGLPMYCLTIHNRRNQLLVGGSEGIRIYALDEEHKCGHVIDSKLLYYAQEHSDIVRCIVCLDSRIYSAGFDQRLVIYDSSYTGQNSLHAVFNNEVHDAGITSLVAVRDNESNSWIISGSFDKSCKMWSVDGKLVYKMDNFAGPVTGICFIPRNKTLWVVAGSATAWMFDPKSGDNVSDFIGTFSKVDEMKYYLHLLRYFPEVNQAIASTNRRQIIAWKFNSFSCVTSLKCHSPTESLCYTRKAPILIFSGDHDGNIKKWERNQSSPFMYTNELLLLGDLSKPKRSGNRVVQRKKGKVGRELGSDVGSAFRMSTSRPSNLNCLASKSSVYISRSKSNTIYGFDKEFIQIPPVAFHDHPHTTILKIEFIESLDYVLAASEDGNIYVWGFDDTAVEVLNDMKAPGTDDLIHKYAILLDPTSLLLPQNIKHQERDSVTNRVAGFVCKYIFSDHYSCVSSLLPIGREHQQNSTYLLSGAWDRRICLWDLEAGKLKDVCRTTISLKRSYGSELMCDGIITDMAYSPANNEYAYSSSDKMIYLRKFAVKGHLMLLVNTLQGHEGEVTAVKWSPTKNKWISGSEDGTVRIWNGSGLNECVQILYTVKGVTCLCVDQVHGGIVVGVLNTIRVYDPETYRLVQSNLGHTDSVRSIIHVPERSQYVSCSWDHSIRVWNAWKLPRVKKPAVVQLKRFSAANLSSSVDSGAKEQTPTTSTAGV